MASRADARTLLHVIRVLRASGAEPELLGWSAYDWSRILLHIPPDQYNFEGRYERSWDDVIDDLGRWCGEFHDRPAPFRGRYEEVFGYLGLLLITLVSLRHSDAYRYPRANGNGAATHDCRTLCVPLLEEPAVRDAIAGVYAPEVWIPDQEIDHAPAPATQSEWRRIDLDSLRFHRHGTTSFILRGVPAEAAQGQRRPLALKCLLYPYLRVPTIVRATREYADRYGVPSRDVRHLVRIWASSSSWILMDFVPGETLTEHLERRNPKEATRRELRVDLLTELGRELFAAMGDLERAGLRHCDLSPSNIIVTRDHDTEGPLFVLVDLGSNHLYSHALPGLEGSDADYVAPEIRAGDEQTDKSDLYSVGQLLVAITGVLRQGGSVPDRFYAETPVMARFIEDLVDEDPEHRLLIFRPDPAEPLYPQLRSVFDEELDAMKAVRSESTAAWGPRWLAALFLPLAGAPGRQRRIWHVRRSQGLYRNPDRGMHVRWLLFWSMVSALTWYVAAAVVITWWLRDIGWDWGNQAIALLQRATGTPQDRFPYLDALRASDYPIKDAAGNLPVRMVGMSFLLVGARHYQNVLGGLTPLVTGMRQGRLSLLAVLAELNMRLFAVLAFCLVMPPTLVERRWWSIFTAVGIAVVFVCNLAILAFARLTMSRAAEAHLSTVPAGRIAGLEAIRNWVATSAFYSFATWIIGLSIYHGLLKDIYVYAGAVTAINFVIFYVIKCSGDSAADVRVALGRACLAAERLRRVRDAPRADAAAPGTDRVKTSTMAHHA